MGRLTEAFHYFSTPNLTEDWMRKNFAWFESTYQDRKIRSFLLKNKTKKSNKKLVFKSKDLFSTNTQE